MPLAPSVVHAPSLLRVAASRVITRMRRMEAISPTTRKGSITRTCERMEIYRVQNLHQHQHNEELVQYPQSLGCNRPMTEIDPQDLARGGDGHKGRDSQQHGENGVDDYLGFAKIVVKAAA